MKRTYQPKVGKRLKNMVSDQRWQLKVEKNFLREDVIRDVKILQCHLLKKSHKVNKPD